MEYRLHQSEFDQLRDLVYETCGIKLGDTKREMLRGRLSRRLRALSLPSFSSYLAYVKSPLCSEGELTQLINCVTTNKTDFFREPHHFEFVVDTILPELARHGQSRFDVWHAGCSTGEEPYTLAITLLQSPVAERFQIRQLATDIDTDVIDHATAGIYDLDRLRTVPPEVRDRYFLRGKNAMSGHARTIPELSQWLTFGRLNLLESPWPLKPETRFDLIFCRNVMIYFDKTTQQRLVERFAQVLRPGGYLFIGHSETLTGISDSFENLGKTVFRKVGP